MTTTTPEPTRPATSCRQAQQQLRHRLDVPPPAQVPQLPHQPVGEAGQRQPVVVHQRHVAQGRRQPPDRPVLRRLAPRHRAAGVEQHLNAQVLLGQEQLQEQLVQPAVDVPVHEAQVVADHVRPVVGELHALPAALGPPLALELALEDLPAEDVQGVQAGDEVAVQQLGDAAGRRCPGRGSHFTSMTSSRVRGVFWRISATTSSLRTPSAWPSKFSRMRWRSEGRAEAAMSS